MLVTSAKLLKSILRSLDSSGAEDSRLTNVIGKSESSQKPKPRTREEKLVVDGSVDSRDGSEDDEEEEEDDEEEDDDVDDLEEDVSRWSLDEKEKLLHVVAKTFYAHFPLYAVQKHSFHRLDDLGQKEAALVSSYCDVNDPEVPILLLRNITFYCAQDVMDLFVGIFSKATPETLPLSLAHAIIAVIHHLKYGLNVNTLLAKLVSLRSWVINYLCKVYSENYCILIRNFGLPESF